jgi:hypothetical protein
MSEHLDRAAATRVSPRAMNYREVAESVGAIALEHVASGADSNAPLWAYAHARAAAHFARLHLTAAAD